MPGRANGGHGEYPYEPGHEAIYDEIADVEAQMEHDLDVLRKRLAKLELRMEDIADAVRELINPGY